ncbi:MAG: hypothetical protein EON98_09645 [Chitinophagaceae bacterium]|nr:MAG: hypothetical protein EON98_09645 [Chitinophagaceae bacterium]
MSLQRFNFDFDKTSDPKRLAIANLVYTQVSTNVALFPSPTPGMLQLRDAIDEYQVGVIAAGNGDRLLIGQKQVAKEKVIKMLYQLSHYVLMVANGDRFVAQQSGFTLPKEQTARVLDVPTGLEIEAGNQSGELLVSVDAVKGAASYMHQYSTDPLLKEESWVTMNCTSSKCKLTGLTPGATYYIRVGAVGSKEQVLYGTVASKIVS